ncbi:MAG: DUF262 domain-containing protein [Dongiaceae bacterium]
MATSKTQVAPLEEEVEGIDAPQSEGWGDYPLDSVFVRSELRTVGEVISRINKNRYIMDPDFQRDFVWAEEKQSKLIESCVMRIPLPVFYVAEAKDGRVIVVDGLQRLTTFARFKSGDLKLKGLGSKEKTHPLEGQTYKELPITLQERVDDTQLTMYILDSKAPERARLDIFERVNSGVPLTRQQMRNALYNGPATEWLKAAARTPLFEDVTGGSLSPKTMRDREAINRFCAFSLIGWQRYTGGDMDGHLGQALDLMNSMKAKQREDLRKDFDRSLLVNKKLFGRHAFRKSLVEAKPTAARSIINIALFEVFSVLLSRVHDDRETSGLRAIRKAVASLFEDRNFMSYISYSTNSTIQVRGRFQIAERALREFLQ